MLRPSWVALGPILVLLATRLLAQSVAPPPDSDSRRPSTPLVTDTAIERATVASKRLPVPEAESQRAALDLVKSVFQADFDEANEEAAKRSLAARQNRPPEEARRRITKSQRS